MGLDPIVKISNEDRLLRWSFMIQSSITFDRVNDLLVLALVRASNYAFSGAEFRRVENFGVALFNFFPHHKKLAYAVLRNPEGLAGLGLSPFAVGGLAEQVIFENRLNFFLPGEIAALDVFLEFYGLEDFRFEF